MARSIFSAGMFAARDLSKAMRRRGFIPGSPPAILAAIVIPQFTNASQDARKSSLVSQLQTLRSQIELFKLQHGDVLPDLVTDWTPMTTVTAYAGKNYGPYMQAIPLNPLTGGSTVKDGTGAAAVAGADFIYDKTGGTGRIYGTSENVNGTKYVE